MNKTTYKIINTKTVLKTWQRKKHLQNHHKNIYADKHKISYKLINMNKTTYKIINTKTVLKTWQRKKHLQNHHKNIYADKHKISYKLMWLR